MAKSCRHRDAWAVAAGYLMWCPDCGSLMSMRRETDGSWSYRWHRWLKPNGQTKTLLSHARLESAAKSTTVP